MKDSRDREICQIGLVVRDLRKSIDNYRALGVGPWDFHRMNDQTVAYYFVDDKLVEEPFEFQIGIAHFNNVEIELMQPIKGPNLYWDFLEKKGEGMHHVKEYIPTGKIEEVADSYRKRGIRVLANGKFGEDMFFYLDTEKELGTILELGNRAPCPPPAEVIPL